MQPACDERERDPGRDRDQPREQARRTRRQQARAALRAGRPTAETDERVEAPRLAEEAIGENAGGKFDQQRNHRRGLSAIIRRFERAGILVMPNAAALMVQGTTSDAGKSTLVAGLARCSRGAACASRRSSRRTWR